MEGLSFLWSERVLLLDGMWQTIYIAMISLFFSLLGGLVVGFLRSLRNPILGFITRFYLEAFRIIPLIVWLIAAVFIIPRLVGGYVGISTSVIIVFVLWGSAEMGEMVRGALESLPKIQKESGLALGLSNMQLYTYILIPQAFRRMLPGVINMATRLIKTTAITTMAGVVEIFSRGMQIVERTGESFALYAFIFFFFFALCYPLTLYSRYLEKRLRLKGGA